MAKRLRSWNEISSDHKFMVLPAEEKEKIRSGYFDVAIAPHYQDEDIRTIARHEFDKNIPPINAGSLPLTEESRANWRPSKEKVLPEAELEELTSDYRKKRIIKDVAMPLLTLGKMMSPATAVDDVASKSFGMKTKTEEIEELFGIDPENMPKAPSKEEEVRMDWTTLGIGALAGPARVPGWLGKTLSNVAGKFVGRLINDFVKNAPLVSMATLGGQVGQGIAEQVGAGDKVKEIMDNPYTSPLQKMGAQLVVDPERAKAIGQFAGGLSTIPMQILASLTHRGKQLLTKPGREKLTEEVYKVVESPTAKAGIDLAKSKAGEIVAKQLAAEPNVLQNMDEAFQLETMIPGIQFGAAQRTGSQFIKENMAKMAKTDPELYGKLAAEERKNVEKIGDYLGQRGMGTSADELFGGMATKRQSAIEELMPKYTSEELGRELITERGKTAKTVSNNMNEIFNTVRKTASEEVGQTGIKGARFDLGETFAKADDLAKQGVLEYEPRMLSPVVGRIAETKPAGKIVDVHGDLLSKKTEMGIDPTNATIEDVQTLERAINPALSGEWRKMNSATATDEARQLARSRYRALAQLKSELYSSMEKSGFPKTTEAHLASQTAYRKQFANLFLKGPLAELEANKTSGETLIAPEQVFNTIFRSEKGVSDVRSISKVTEAFKNNPEALDLVEQGIKDKFYHDVFPNGEFNEGQFRRFFAKYGDAVTAFDKQGGRKVKEALGKNIESIQMLSDSQAERLMNTKAVERNRLVDILKIEDPDKVAQELLASPSAMRQFAATQGKEGSAAFAAYTMRNFADKIREGELHSVGLKELLDNKQQKASLTILAKSAYGEKEGLKYIQNLEIAQKALAINERFSVSTIKPEIAELGESWLKKNFGFDGRSLLASVRSVKIRGHNSVADAFYWHASMAGKTQFQKLMINLQQEAIANPAALKDYITSLQALNAKNAEKFKSSFSSLLGYAGMILANNKFLIPTVARMGPSGVKAIAPREPTLEEE